MKALMLLGVTFTGIGIVTGNLVLIGVGLGVAILFGKPLWPRHP